LARRYEFYVLVARTISHSFAWLTREIFFLPLEHKIHIFSPPYNILYVHSHPQSPRSFWPAAGIEGSGLVQHRKSAIHGLPVKSGKSDWLRIRNEYSAHAQKIGSGQSPRSLPQARRIVGSGDENGQHQESRPDFLSMCRVFVSYFQPIRFVRF